VPQREAPTPHKFKVEMYDFMCEDLAVDDNCEPFLQIDFDHFKIFKTDCEPNSRSPEWCFKAGFTYVMNYLEKLGRAELRVQCFNRINGQAIGEAAIDLQTIACGPAHYKLTLREQRTREPRGLLKFTCVMKMIAPNLTVVCKDLKLTMMGGSAPARLQISCTLDEVEEDLSKVLSNVTNVPHSQEGIWPGPCSLSFEMTLGDLLQAPNHECLRFVVIDEMGVRQGEALLEFRKAFSAKPDTPISFKVPVTYTCTVDGEEKPEPVGAVGELEGVLLYQNLPVYAQMAGGLCIDGQVEGGCWLFEGLPYPHCMPQPPPIWQDPADRTGVECFMTLPQPHEDGETRIDDFDDDKLFEALDTIDLPPPWEKRRDRCGGRMYFADPRSRRTTWKDPRFLPENWDQRIDPQTGKVYFQYHKTRQTTYVDPRCCPPGWDMRLSKDGDIYFAYMPAMQTTYTDPRGLPDHIDACLDDIGRVYFKNHEAKLTTWDDPREAQQEVTLTKWRHGQSTRWWKEQVWKEIEEMSKQRNEIADREDHDGN